MHSAKEYRLNLVHKTRNFMKKVYHYLNPSRTIQNKETFGFKSANDPPSIVQLKEFEDGMISLVENIKFKKHSNNPCEFQRKLSNDIRIIKSNKNVTVKGEKCLNFYNVHPQRYNELVKNTVTKEYKKSTRHQEEPITKKGYKVSRVT